MRTVGPSPAVMFPGMSTVDEYVIANSSPSGIPEDIVPPPVVVNELVISDIREETVSVFRNRTDGESVRNLPVGIMRVQIRTQ